MFCRCWAGLRSYELTAIGQALEKTLLEFGEMGPPVCAAIDGRSSRAARGFLRRATAKFFLRPELAQGVDEPYALHIGDEVQQIRIADGAITVQQGEPPAAMLRFTPRCQFTWAYFWGSLTWIRRWPGGLIGVTGDLDALRRFFTICRVPWRSRHEVRAISGKFLY